MVRILAPSHCKASVVHDLTAIPSMWTTQAPHCDVSQPTCVPVSRKFSRRNCTSKVRASTSPVTALPFTVIDTADITVLPIGGQRPSFSPRRSRPERFVDGIEPILADCALEPE